MALCYQEIVLATHLAQPGTTAAREASKQIAQADARFHAAIRSLATVRKRGQRTTTPLRLVSPLGKRSASRLRQTEPERLMAAAN
jgi:hypothetical protein